MTEDTKQNNINNTSEQLTGADLVIKVLFEDLNVRDIFGYPGGAILPIYDALFRDGRINHYLTRHEQAAGHAGEAYAKSSRGVGVIFATSGPGATNIVTALTDAYMDSIPLVAITGQVMSELIGTDGFQEADVVGITRSCTKHNYLVKDVNDLEKIIKEAFYIATSGRPGPVLIDIPKDIQNMDVSYKGIKNINRKSLKIKEEKLANKEHELEMNIIKAFEVLKKAQKPVLYIGGGAVNSGKEAEKLIREFINESGYPATCTMMGIGAVNPDSSNFLGMTGMHGSYEANMSMYECDVLFCIGARFDDRVTGNLSKFSPNSIKIHIDIDETSIGKNVLTHIPLNSDVKNIMNKLLSKWREKEVGSRKDIIKEWWNRIEEFRSKKSFEFKQTEDSTILPQYAISLINKISKKVNNGDKFITTDVGQHQMWSAQYFEIDGGNRWMSSSGLGTMGFGLPAAIGAKVANPDSTIICISGDASIMMNIQELSTIKQYDLDIKLFILNNSYMGMVKQWQDMFHGKRRSQSYVNSLPNFELLAQSFGIKGITCSDKNELPQKIEEALSYKGSVVFNCLVAKHEMVYPMIPAGAGHNEVILGN